MEKRFRALRHRVTGFTLIEVVVYIGLFVLLFVSATTFFTRMLRATASVRIEQTTVTNAAVALEAVEREVRQADALYTPTSVFDNNAGQLSVTTPRNAPADHPLGYVDFYLDNGVVYEKRDDGTAAIPLSAGDTQVTVFRIERYAHGSAEGVRITITAVPRNVPTILTVSRTLRTFVAIRPFNP